jgi:hypothetical protein
MTDQKLNKKLLKGSNVLGVIKHLGEIRHRISNNLLILKRYGYFLTSHFKHILLACFLEVKKLPRQNSVAICVMQRFFISNHCADILH